MTEQHYRKTGQVLPESTTKTLKGASSRERNLYIVALVRAGWTQSSIATALGLSRERVRQIVDKNEQHLTAEVARLLEAVPTPPVIERPQRASTRVERPEPTPAIVERLRELKPVAQSVRAGSEVGRAEAEEYTRLIWEQSKAGVPLTKLAGALGVTPGALRSRLIRYGYMSDPQTGALLGVVHPE